MSSESRMTEASSPRAELKSEQSADFHSALRNICDHFIRLINFFQLKEDEQKDAGIYLGDHHYK
jgi:hypothetical protein